MGLVGESGSGKSVTRLLDHGVGRSAGRVVGGEILFDGVDLTRLAQAEMRALPGGASR